MSSPKLLNARVKIEYWSDDGYESKVTFGEIPREPEEVLRSSFCELARLCELFGFGDIALIESKQLMDKVRVAKGELLEVPERLTAKGLAEALLRYPDALVMAYDPNSEQAESITGYVVSENQKAIELYTDEP